MCDDFSVLYDCKLITFGVKTIYQTKQTIFFESGITFYHFLGYLDKILEILYSKVLILRIS